MINKTFELAAGQVHLWCANLDVSEESREKYFSYLSENEVQRAQRMHFPAHRKRFIVARGQLRVLVGEYLDLKPAEVQFSYAEKNKPYLAQNKLQFNVSHSHAVAIYAFTLEQLIGVDVEKVKEEFEESVAKRYFNASEYADLMKSPAAERPRKFYWIWARKEALVKAVGDGLHFPLPSFSVAGSDSTELPFNNESNWYLQSFAVHKDYQSAFATRQKVSQVWLGKVAKNMKLSELKA
jgi:4'-phosphopantetheinyl transferase